MPRKMSKKGGGAIERSFDEGVSGLKKLGKSDESVRKIMASLQKKHQWSKTTITKKREQKS